MTLGKQIRAILLLPVLVTIFVPAGILCLTRSLCPGWGLYFPLLVLPYSLGALLVGGGLALLCRTVALFINVGRGTLAPWDPPQELVVSGPYCYVRNPMISGVLAIVLGEAALLGSCALAAWFLLFLLGNAIYFPLSEEPGLERRFGEAYLAYKENVPRWLPRLTPWQPQPEEE